MICQIEDQPNKGTVVKVKPNKLDHFEFHWPMSKTQSLRPQWVLYKKVITPVNQFTGIPPKDRPVVQCPGCHEDVTMKIGNINPPHYAHKPGSYCNETALHLNTKMNLVSLLSTVDQLSYQVECMDRCGNVKEQLLLSGWDEVKPEFTLGSIRPDITLLKGEIPLACIEVTHTHGIGPAKRDYLYKANLPTIELKASDNLCSWDHPGVVPAPSILSLMLVDNVNLYYRCKACEEKRNNFKVTWKRVEAPPFPVHPPGSKILTLAACCWDIYMVNGHRYRESFQVRAEIVAGTYLRKWIEDKKGRTVCSIDQPDDSSSMVLDEKLNEHVESSIPKQRFDFIDHRQRWKRVNPKHSHLDAGEHCKYPYKYRMNLKTGEWIAK